MTIDIKTPPVIRKKAFSCALLGLLAGISTLPVTAASAGQPIEPAAPQSAQADQPAGVLFRYLQIAGAAFHPFDTTTTYSYPGAGCISKTGGAGSLFTHKVVLPAGSVVRFLRLYFYDNASSSVTAFIYTYNGVGNFSQLTSVGSETSGGFNTTLSPAISYEVNPATAAINVVANLGTQNDSTLRFCGVRIAYDAPITDRIFADDFDFTPL
ncbi:hypothetical protein [Dokdonella sp.]|uniref:hypothetical protein n=1 Tax=Dokdonella sp. TaxID=2291710 RepID=UPI003C560CB1